MASSLIIAPSHYHHPHHLKQQATIKSSISCRMAPTISLDAHLSKQQCGENNHGTKGQQHSSLDESTSLIGQNFNASLSSLEYSVASSTASMNQSATSLDFNEGSVPPAPPSAFSGPLYSPAMVNKERNRLGNFGSILNPTKGNKRDLLPRLSNDTQSDSNLARGVERGVRRRSSNDSIEGLQRTASNGRRGQLRCLSHDSHSDTDVVRGIQRGLRRRYSNDSSGSGVGALAAAGRRALLRRYSNDLAGGSGVVKNGKLGLLRRLSNDSLGDQIDTSTPNINNDHNQPSQRRMAPSKRALLRLSSTESLGDVVAALADDPPQQRKNGMPMSPPPKQQGPLRGILRRRLTRSEGGSRSLLTDTPSDSPPRPPDRRVTFDLPDESASMLGSFIEEDSLSLFECITEKVPLVGANEGRPPRPNPLLPPSAKTLGYSTDMPLVGQRLSSSSIDIGLGGSGDSFSGWNNNNSQDCDLGSSAMFGSSMDFLYEEYAATVKEEDEDAADDSDGGGFERYLESTSSDGLPLDYFEDLKDDIIEEIILLDERLTLSDDEQLHTDEDEEIIYVIDENNLRMETSSYNVEGDGDGINNNNDDDDDDGGYGVDDNNDDHNSGDDGDDDDNSLTPEETIVTNKGAPSPSSSSSSSDSPTHVMHFKEDVPVPKFISDGHNSEEYNLTGESQNDFGKVEEV